MTTIDLPLLTGELDAANITSWLNLCTDSFEVWSALNSEKPVKPSLQIVLAGLKMESPLAKHWWNENRDELKVLPTWDAFAQRVKDRFVPANWRMDALAKFYRISQGSSPFLDFVTALQTARNALASSGAGFTINDSIHKNHLLFFCHPVLSLRVRSIPNFDYGDMKIDALIGLMGSTWDSIVAENIVQSPNTGAYGNSTATLNQDQQRQQPTPQPDNNQYRAKALYAYQQREQPTPQPDNIQYKAKALYAYTANSDDPTEISFAKGEILDIVDKQGKWWQSKKADGSTGIAPSNYLQII